MAVSRDRIIPGCGQIEEASTVSGSILGKVGAQIWLENISSLIVKWLHRLATTGVRIMTGPEAEVLQSKNEEEDPRMNLYNVYMCVLYAAPVPYRGIAKTKCNGLFGM